MNKIDLALSRATIAMSSQSQLGGLVEFSDKFSKISESINGATSASGLGSSINDLMKNMKEWNSVIKKASNKIGNNSGLEISIPDSFKKLESLLEEVDELCESDDSSSSVDEPEEVTPIPETSAGVAKENTPTTLSIEIACSLVKRMIPLLGPVSDECKVLTLQQFLLEEILKLGNWPDEEFRKCAIGLVLQLDGDKELPLVGFRALNPFPVSNPQHAKYNLIFSLAPQKQLMTVPLETIQADERSSLSWEQGQLDSQTANRLKTMYGRVLDLMIDEYEFQFQGLNKIVSNATKNFNRLQLKQMVAENLKAYKDSSGVVLDSSDELLRVETLVEILKSSSKITERQYKLLKNANSELSDQPEPRINLVRLGLRIDAFHKSLLAYYSIAKKRCEPVTTARKAIAVVARDAEYLREFDSLKTIDQRVAFCRDILKEMDGSAAFENIGYERSPMANNWVMTWSKRALTLEELMENFPTSYNKVKFRAHIQEVFRSMTSGGMNQTNRQQRQKIKRFRTKHDIHEETEIERMYNYDKISTGIIFDVNRKKRLLEGSLEALKRHVGLIASKMEPSADYSIPQWILELDALPASPPTKHKNKAIGLLTPSSSSYTPPEEEYSSSSEDTSESSWSEVSTPAIVSSALVWDRPIDPVDTFNKLRVFPELSIAIQGQLVPRSVNLQEARLLQEALHHLFLLNQGMQILLTAVLHDDRNALIVALPNLVLDHHSFVECYLKSRIAAVSNELSAYHALEPLGYETGQPQEVFPYLQAFKQGALWERYLYTSRALLQHTNKQSPEALNLIGEVVEGKMEPEKIAAFAMNSYRQLLHFMIQNRISVGDGVLENVEQLFEKITAWSIIGSKPEVVVPQRAASGKGKGRKTNVPQSAPSSQLKRVEETLRSINEGPLWEDSPVIPAKEVIAHYKRLEAAKDLLNRFRTIELVAYHDRNVQTATYLFEQAYRARSLAVEGTAHHGHGFAVSQRLLDPTKEPLNRKTNAFFVGIARRYPVYFKQHEFISLLRASRTCVGVEEGFKVSGQEGALLQKRATQLKNRFEECQKVADEQIKLLGKDLEAYRDECE